MRALSGEQVLVRIFIGEGDKFHHQPLHLALLERLRREGFANAVAIRGLAGFGLGTSMQSSHLLRLSQNLPIILEVIDSDEQLAKLKPILDEMITSPCMVTSEKVQVLRYS